MPTALQLTDDLGTLADVDSLLVIGRAGRLRDPDIVEQVGHEAWRRMVDSTEPGDNGRTARTWTTGKPAQIIAGVLPEVCSRHNSPSRAWAIPRMVASAPRKGSLGILLALDDASHAMAAAAAAARSLRLFEANGKPRRERQVTLCLVAPGGVAIAELDALRATCDAVRMAARLVDMPPNQLHTDGFVSEAEAVAAAHDTVSIHITRGEDLEAQGFGGIWNVGKAARRPPAMVVLDHDPGNATSKVSLVGKGIVYDTGGLSLKGKAHMVTMKNDMGGAAAVIAAFDAAARLKLPVRLTAVLCLAENAIGPDAVRPDDIITMHSGKTVEINNTDAEGRLVLADGVSWVTKNRQPDVLIDLATLTGAQSVATGKRQAAVYCNDDELERAAVVSGRATGDLVHPLPYVPEFFRGEFSSVVADMRNSVKDRGNAQSSCAAQFVGNHLGDYGGKWLHVDMAGPVMSGGRGTGFGPALLLGILGVR